MITSHLRKKYNLRDIKRLSKINYFWFIVRQFIKRLWPCFQTQNAGLIVGGPPCQDFSGIGVRRSYSVDKVQLPSNHLFQDMAYFVHMIKPKMFLFENVEGLLRAHFTDFTRLVPVCKTVN